MPEFSSVTGLEGVKFAPLKKENGVYIASKIIDYPYAINAKVNTETSTEKQYADNKLVDMAVTTGSTKLELEMRDLPMEILAELLGIEATDGLYMFKKNIIPPWVAMSFFGPKANGNHRHVGLVKGRFSLPDDEWKTKEEKTNFQTIKLSAEFMEREQDNVFKVLADEDAPSFSLDKFYTKVFGDAYKSPSAGDNPNVNPGK
ncbi:phage tail protein [Bacillus sp. WMMC1349]|uniref:major tail protein n=1 Tax=Bacillus sp. WMMC1349 TaxID=2736254 RepID=UPI001552B240|nr:major tail protein [Bacillus sp. WMMC1349]NPC90966.1 phage tail protein [Bacillus sp. WMMC1349]NPC91019.1 phage tail protein [Bacillus sp. WMMC1349]NPC91064.1 phage tail protein [Bacillus sp. WMMC1349]NPC95003.1 phage tail protein [Bacillus sp. WMMC1349]